LNGKYDKERTIIPRQDVKLQLFDNEVNIGRGTKTTEVEETSLLFLEIDRSFEP